MVIRILLPLQWRSCTPWLQFTQTAHLLLFPRPHYQVKNSFLIDNVSLRKVSFVISKPCASFNSLSSLPSNCVCPAPTFKPLIISHRCKSKRKQHGSADESDSDVDDNLDEDDFDAPPQFKVHTIHAPSLRTDAVLSNSLNISRHRLEELFFSSSLLLNGAKITKKGIKMDEGDYVDVIMDKLEDGIKVKRVKLLSVNSQKTTTDKFILKVRIWKTPFLLDRSAISRERP